MNRLLFSGIALLFSLQIFAQAQFKTKVHDFGEVEEDGGNVDYTFRFKNNYKEPISIMAVDVECGCTTPEWSEKAIPAGGEGIIKAEYEPYNRPGIFDKHLTVRTTKDTTELTIKGNVLPRERSNAEEELPDYIGNLLMKSTSLQMGVIKTNGEAHKDFQFYNNSEKPIIFKIEELEVPEYMEVKIEPLVLAPKTYGKIIISYDPIKKNDFGYMVDFISINTTDETEPVKELAVRATIEEYFPPMTEEQKAKAPQLFVLNPIYDFGNASSSQPVSYAFEIENTGKTPLKIRKVKSACSCLTAEMEKETIAPGAKTKLKLVFDTSDRTGYQSKSVYIYSNSPTNPVQVVKIKGRI